MSSINLTRAEAERRSRAITVHRYDIRLDLTGAPTDATHFPSTTRITLTAHEPIDTFLDLRDAIIDRATLDDDPLDGLDLSLTPGDHTIVVEARCAYMTNGQGLHRFRDPADGHTYLYTQFETADAKRVFACFDQPDMKARFSLDVTAPEGWTVVSNDVDVPLSTYLVAVCAGPWHVVRDSWRDTIPLGIFCRQSLAEHLDAERIFSETKEGFDFFSRHFGEPYPFGKYDQVFCPEYNFGAMENAACVTFRDEYIFRSRATATRYEARNNTILHEMAHMWFGDLVTMRWWDDLWLNESFATWSATAAQAEIGRYPHPWTSFTAAEKNWALRQDQLPTTHPIAADAPDINTAEQNFDGITYAKGASVLKQLVAYVGYDAFLAGARLYFSRHRFANATFADLLSALSDASGRDLSGWADQWLTTTGVTTLEADYDIADDGTFSRFAILQHGGERDHRLAIGIYSGAERTHQVHADISGARTDIPELIGVPAGDFVLPNDDDLTYALLRLDPAAFEHIADFTDPMPRTLCWGAAWQMVRHGHLSPRAFIEVVDRGLPVETHLPVAQQVMQQAVLAACTYASLPSLQDTFLRIIRDNPGTDLELAALQALATMDRLSDASIATLSTVVDERTDLDLRWRCLTALVAAGQRGEEDIAALAAADPSGAESAARARAAIPTADAKERAWEAALGGELSNTMQLATVMGIQAPGSEDLLRSLKFDDRYFDNVVGWWDAYSSDTATRLVTHLFPRWAIDEATIARAEAIEAPGPVKRILAECTEELRVALRLRQL